MQTTPAQTAAQSQAETTHMARRLFVAPPPRRMAIPIAAFSAMEGFLLLFPSLDPARFAAATLAIAVPAFASALLTTPLAEALGGRMYLRRSALLVFVGLLALGGVLVVAVAALSVYAIAAGASFAYAFGRVAVLGYGIVFWIRFVILASTSNSDYARSLPAAALHPALGLLGLAAVVPVPLEDALLALVVHGIFGAMAVAYAEIAKRPLLRSFGIDGLKLLRHTLDHYTELEDVGVAELERFFERIGVPARVRVPGVAFRTDAGPIAVLLAPAVHPGPMGYVGGSDLPSKIAEGLRDLTPNILVAHGPTTHDDNPATTAEVRRLAEAVREALPRASFARTAGRSVRVASGRASLLAQSFGEAVVLVASFAPNPTDDIDAATGHAAIQEARLAGAREALLIDAHNCLVPGVGLTHFGSPGSHEILQGARAATDEARAAPRGPVRAGYARRSGFCTPEDGIGARGVEALVVEVDGQRTAYVLFDGNNMVPGLREAIRARIGSLVEESEVLTSDNHSVNLTMEGFNAVGAVLDQGTILEQAEGAVREAVESLADVEGGFLTGEVPDLRIFGPQAASRLTTAINATLAVLRPALYITMSGAVAASALILVAF